MNAHDTQAGQLLSDLNDFLTGLETVLHTASIDKRIATENAAGIVYGVMEGGCHTTITNTVAEPRDHIYNHLEN